MPYEQVSDDITLTAYYHEISEVQMSIGCDSVQPAPFFTHEVVDVQNMCPAGRTASSRYHQESAWQMVPVV
jgi:hypothetical protein